MKRLYAFMTILTLLSVTGCKKTSVLFQEEISVSEVIFLHNKERGQVKIHYLEKSSDLQKTAQSWAESMAKKERMKHGNSFVNPNFRYGGENIAMGYKNVDVLMESWMNSSGHKSNILNKKYTHIGFGFAFSSNGQPYFCVQFGGN